MSNPRWRQRREVYLRESGRRSDLMREGFIAGKLDEVVEGGRQRREVSKRQVTLILVPSAGAKLLPEQKDC